MTIEGTPVEVVDSLKILGLTIQNDMKWHKHPQYYHKSKQKIVYVTLAETCKSSPEYNENSVNYNNSTSVRIRRRRTSLEL